MSEATRTSLVDELTTKLPDMLDLLRAFVEAESPTADVSANRACAQVIADRGEALLGRPPEMLEVQGRPHVRWRGDGPTRVLMLAHQDTVWPLGTIDRWPFAVDDDKATGPGTYDMKAGLVQGMFALAAHGSLDGTELLVTSDEETGSATSQRLIEDDARGLEAVLVLEPSWPGSLKVARKGCYTFRITAHGRAAHAGLGPQGGRNALTSIAHQVLAVNEIGRGATTVTPTMAKAGTTANTVPALAELIVDVRTPTLAEFERVDREIRALEPGVEDVRLDVELVTGRPPMERSSSDALFAIAQRLAPSVGIPELKGIEVGGGSDGNFTAAIGTPTLDGLGAIGDGAHAEGEHVIVSTMPQQAALVAALLRELLGGD